MTKTNNQYLKEIAENFVGEIDGNHMDNYYLKRIAVEGYGCSYTQNECNGRYYKDIAEKLGSTTYNSHHFNNFYLKEICTALTGQDYNNHFDNYYLEIWATAILNREESKLVWLVPPSNMEYGDFNASGVLTDKNDNSVKISGATVNLVIGSTVVDTGVTDSNGVVTFEDSPVHVGTHSFKLVFNGNQSYENSESSVVTITVSKETTYLNVEEYDSTGYTDGTVYISGQLLDNDSPQHSVTGETVKIIDKSDDTVLGTVITDNQGYFDCDLELSASNYSIRIIYEGTDDYNSSYEDISIEVLDPYLEVIADKPILSYADHESATLTATFHAANNSGQTVTFEVRKESDDSLVETLTDDTNSSGVATVSYLGKGTGDLYIKCFSSNRMIFSEIYIRDVYFHDSMTSDSGHWTYDSGVTKNYSSDGVSITSSSDKFPVCDVALPNNFKLTFKAKSNSNNNLRYCVLGGWHISNAMYSSVNRFTLFNAWPPQYYVNDTYSQPNVVEFEAEYNNGTLTLKKDGATIITQTITLDNQVLQLYAGGNTTITIKDIIVEEL